jgi:hypothetical protein
MSQLPHPHTIAALLRQALAEGNQPRLTITSNSMAPLLRRGDVVRLASTKAASLRPGDVIVLVTPENLLTHRYWGNIADGRGIWLITRGDRPLGFDRPTMAQDLVGKVIARHRGERELSLTGGRGERLNQRLARLAARESRWLGAAPPVSVEDSCVPPVLTVPHRVLRRLLFLWARFLAVRV